MRVSDVLVLNTRKNTIEKIYTCSCHEKLAKAELNKLLSEKPEWYNTIYALTILPLLVWADKDKEERPMPKRLYEIGNYRYRNTRLNNGQIKKITNSIVGLLCSGVNAASGPEGDCLRAVFLGGDCVSKYMLTTHLRNAVRHLCENHFFVIDVLFSELHEHLKHLSPEERCVLHDINSLFLIGRDCRKNCSFVAEEKETRHLLFDLTQRLTYCEVCDKETREIIERYVEGDTEMRLCEEFSRSQTYIRNRIQNAKKMMAVYMWGLTTNDFLSHI